MPAEMCTKTICVFVDAGTVRPKKPSAYILPCIYIFSLSQNLSLTCTGKCWWLCALTLWMVFTAPFCNCGFTVCWEKLWEERCDVEDEDTSSMSTLSQCHPVITVNTSSMFPILGTQILGSFFSLIDIRTLSVHYPPQPLQRVSTRCIQLHIYQSYFKLWISTDDLVKFGIDADSQGIHQ